MRDYDEIERQYIQEQLDLHAEYLADLFLESIEKNQLIESENLLSHFNNSSKFWKVFPRGGAEILSFEFPIYGRFIEIQQRTRKKIRTETPDTKALLWGITNKKKRKGKNARWYTKNVYGAQNELIGKLMWGFSDIQKQRIVELLKSKQK